MANEVFGASNELETVRDSFKSSLLSVINNSSNPNILKGFIVGYEYRSRFPWLGESDGRFTPEELDKIGIVHKPGKTPVDGIKYALKYALATYLPIHKEDADSLAQPTVEAEDTLEEPIDEEWKLLLQEAASSVAEDETVLYEFFQGMDFAGYNVDYLKSNPDTLAHHIEKSMDGYYTSRNVGTSRDPL